MKKIYSLILLFFCQFVVEAQITITASDMPVAGDTLRYSFTNDGSIIDLNATGPNVKWDYGALKPVGQQVDNYKTAIQVNPLYVTISPNAYGYKVADSFPGLGSFLPISIKEIYTFYSKKPIGTPNRYVAEGFGAKVASIPTPELYSDEDELYYFPLDYTNTNNSTFRLKIDFPTLGSMVQKGTRNTTVDGWGTMITPYFSNPVDVIRVRSEILETDSINIPPLPAIGIPRNSVEYKWLAKNEHYPVLWVVTSLVGGNETITAVRYRDSYRPGLLGVTQSASKKYHIIKTYPNPAVDQLSLELPDNWTKYTVSVYDIQSRLVGTYATCKLDIAKLSQGRYLVVVSTGNETAYAWFEK